MHLSPLGSSRKHSSIRNKKESRSMQSLRLSSRIGAILSLLGGALVIYGVFFLPMVFGNGGGSFEPHSEWYVANNGSSVALGLLALLLLSVLLILVTSAVSFFRDLSPGIVTWRRIAAIVGLIIQGPVGFVGGVLFTFGYWFGAGYWLVLLGCIIMSVGAFLK